MVAHELSIWLARIAAHFQGKRWVVDDIFFLSMLRTLFWNKAASSGWLVLEQTWWDCPLLCSPSKHSQLPRLGGKPGHGGCSGVLRNQLGNVATLFSGLLGLIDSNVAELITIRTGIAKISTKLNGKRN
ncbi:hypothetical protein V6N13_083361 [Hibiscus sabdariffa]|uniref:Uncharacterized protein n=1 Tax=Hibiscus sabdariffa TaxID=183260 RepID=A0ABR2SXS1_9ROSI